MSEQKQVLGSGTVYKGILKQAKLPGNACKLKEKKWHGDLKWMLLSYSTDDTYWLLVFNKTAQELQARYLWISSWLLVVLVYGDYTNGIVYMLTGYSKITRR